MNTSPEVLRNLPEKFRNIFHETSNNIRVNGDGLFLFEFCLITSKIFLLDKWSGEKGKLYAENGKKLIELVFSNQAFIEERKRHLRENSDEYISSFYSQGIVFLCSSLEDCVKKVISAIIEFDDTVLGIEKFNSHRLSLSEYFRLQKEERFDYLAEKIIENMKCGEKGRFEKYEKSLESFGMTEAIEIKYRSQLSLLFDLRNRIIHHSSIVNSEFCKKYERLNYKVGDKLVFNRKNYQEKEKLVLGYINEIFLRLNKRMGAPEKYLSYLRKSIDEMEIN